MTVQLVLNGEKRWHVEASDCVSFLRSLPEGCIQALVTSPPYWKLRSYLKATDPFKPLEIGQEATLQEYVARMVEVFREARRVLRDDSVCWVNVGDSYNAYNNNRAESKSISGIDNHKHPRHVEGLVCGNLKPLDQCNIPHRLYIALIEDGWHGRCDIVWAKTCSMPESIRGWRWERCRQKVRPQASALSGGQYAAGSGNRTARPASGGVGSGNIPLEFQTEWCDCPGCKKCEKTAGLILRKGSWRPTRSHEYIFMLAKSSNYFCDDMAVRTALAPATLSRDQYSRILDDPDEQCAVAHDHETISNQAGANPRSVFRHDATAMDVFHWLADMDPALGEALWQRWREGQGMHSVLRVGPEPLKAQHYAAFPTALVTPLLKASTSERGQCSACGAPWVRIVERSQAGKLDYEGKNLDTDEQSAARRMHAGVRAAREAGGEHDDPFDKGRSVGWRATCSCNAPTIPHLVLDIFAGSGRTGMAARRLGLRFVGSELNPEFAELANSQIAADAMDVPIQVGVAGPSLFDSLED